MYQISSLCKSLLILFVSTFFINCPEASATEAPPKTNWYTSMYYYGGAPDGPEWCLVPLADNLLIFEGIVRFTDPNVRNYPRMILYIRDAATGLADFSDPIDINDVEPCVLANGRAAYQAKAFFEIDLSQQCEQDPNFCYTMNLQVLTDQDPKNPGLIVAYPYADNPGLFSLVDFDISGNNGRSNYWEAFKEICCPESGYGTDGNPVNDPCNGLNGQMFHANSQSPFNPPVWLVSNQDDNQVATSETLESDADQKEINDESQAGSFVSPNPFSDQVKVTLGENDMEEVYLEWFDIQGRLRSQKAVMKQNTGRQDVIFETSGWSPGVYYLKIRSATGQQTHKLIKT